MPTKVPGRWYGRWKAARKEKTLTQELQDAVAYFFQPSTSNLWLSQGNTRRTNPFGHLLVNTGVELANSLANKTVNRVIPKQSIYCDIVLAAPAKAQMELQQQSLWETELRKFSDTLHAVLERGGFRHALKKVARDYLVVGHAAHPTRYHGDGRNRFRSLPPLLRLPGKSADGRL